MGEEKNETGLYFQTIARFFFEQRGSPFFLSSKELDVIADWREKRIPVQVVLEGIRDCFTFDRRKPGRKNKIHSLVFCRSFVLRAYESYKERRVGGGLKSDAEEGRKKQLVKAVERFLNTCPEEVSELRNMFSEVKEMLSQGFDEESLEQIEKDVERLLFRIAPDSEKMEIRNEVKEEYADKKGQEHARIFELKIIKHMRDKYKIPHISLYYY
jgi:hypothetical protein